MPDAHAGCRRRVLVVPAGLRRRAPSSMAAEHMQHVAFCRLAWIDASHRVAESIRIMFRPARGALRSGPGGGGGGMTAANIGGLSETPGAG